MQNDTILLNKALYANVSPAGAFYVVSSKEQNTSRTLLSSVLKHGSKEPLTEKNLLAWSECADKETALSLLYRLQRLEFIYGTEKPREIDTSNLEQRLPGILKQLSSIGRVLLADENGLYYAGVGFEHESAEEISALAGDVIALSERHSLLIKNNLELNPNAWSVCDPAGQSELGFFSLSFNESTFILVTGGKPQLQNDSFVDLVEILFHRYGN